MALCHDERDYAMGFSRYDPSARSFASRITKAEKPEDKSKRIGPASDRWISDNDFIRETRDAIVRVLHERGPIHFEDFFWRMHDSQSVNGGWISSGEVAAHLQFMKRQGMVRCDRDQQYPKYHLWSLVLPHPLVYLKPAASP